MEDKVYLDVGLKEHGNRDSFNYIEKKTKTRQWLILKIIRSKGEVISHLCLSLVNQEWQLLVTYNQSTTKLFVKKDGKWEEISES